MNDSFKVRAMNLIFFTHNWLTEAGTLYGILGIGLLAVAFFAAKRYFSGRLGGKVNSPRRIFFELCRAHRLTRKESTLLLRIARECGLAQPGILFLDPGYLKQPFKTSVDKARQEKLRRQIFGELAG